ncbi:hypothetical protein H310_06168 [Aphanomyces invadans]|uniref:Calpain catalytic domain-containing protein n=1 Tax=Aphanomyces invadans TaxID=157072 RepID=A0A024U7D8_9STRA|nr:hypothetical protein H310_06168 [Aphanomyces invadans]ETW01503.1 hypothetical protein H310_06168 [Aphanomyces invadans]|eukprot:XP_008869351.1 hypothetical protein H310_06168 [Aphanomyces invadans]
MVFCAECGSRFDDDTARFCAECGSPREMIEPSPPVVTPVTTTPSPAPFATSSSSFRQHPTTLASAPMNAPPPVQTAAPVHAYQSLPSVAVSPSNCSACGTPYVDATERFCGDCGHPRSLPPATPAAALIDDDEDLFGAPPSSEPALASQSPTQPGDFPQATASPTAPAADTTPKLGNYPGAALVAAQLAGLTVRSTKTNAPVVDVHGSGVGISVQDVVSARDMDTLPIRQAISTGFEHNRTRPSQVNSHFHSTQVTPQCTVHDNIQVQSHEEAFYSKRTLPDSTEWTNVLRQHRQAQTQFTDPGFPPTLTSLYRDPAHPITPPGTTPLDSVVWKWKRISDFFSHNAYVEVSILDDDKKLVCGIAMKSQAEAETMIETIRQSGQSVDARFLLRATDTVSAALHKKRADHFLNLTKALIESMQEYVDNGVTKFDLLWQKSLVEAHKPLVFAGVGTPYGYRLDGFGNAVSKVQVLVPIQFQAQQVCLFDREATSSGGGALCKPGRLADGYLFGAISMLSTSPTALSQLFPRLTGDLVQPHMAWPAPHELEQQYNDEGVYCVRFWRNHKSYLVVVDDYIPCGHNGKPVFASFTGSISRFEIWSMIVEKAYAKLYGGYDVIVGGQDVFALQDLFGGLPSSFPTTELGGTDDNAAFTRLSQALQRGNLVGFINTGHHTTTMPLGLKSGHTYGLVKLVQVLAQGRLHTVVQLRNVWADVSDPASMAGGVPWARGGAEWKQCSLDQKQRAGYQLADDGTVWLDLPTVVASFSTVLESKNVYQFPSTVPSEIDTVPLFVHVISSAWKGLTCGGREAIHLNPQFQFTCAESTALLVHLEQPCRRVNMQADYPCYVSPVVVGHADVGHRKLDIAKDVIATGTFVSNRSCLVEVPLRSAGTIAIVPATYVPFETTFQLVVVSTLPLAIGFVSDHDIPVCCVCRHPLQGSYRTYTSSNGVAEHVCQGACADQYRSAHAPVCVECHERIEVVAGRFSGRLFALPDGTSCHAECMDSYRMRHAESCAHCHYAIVKIEGKFDGKFFALDDGKKVHAECMEAYQVSIAKPCRHCGLPIVKGGRFDGRFYQLAASEDQVHFECWDAFQATAAPKCRHCHDPILKVESKFDGRFYDLNDGSGKVHFECWDAFRQQSL